MDRKEENLTPEFAKDVNFEEVLKEMNLSLALTQEQFIQDKSSDFPIIHVIGAPRSGTTLLTQYLASVFDFGYINNLIASFWKAPMFGIELSKRLLTAPYKSSFKSNFGRTDNITEPHEFGYFWNYHLQYPELKEQEQSHEDQIKWDVLTQLLNNMSCSFAKPMIFKSFLLGFHIERMVKERPNTIFVFVKREFMQNAESIYNLRLKLLGSVDKWASIKPIEYELLKDKDEYYQISSQIELLNKKFEKQLERIPASNKLIIEYEQFCKDPYHVANDLKDKVKALTGVDYQIDSQEIKFSSVVKPLIHENEFIKGRQKFLNDFK